MPEDAKKEGNIYSTRAMVEKLDERILTIERGREKGTYRLEQLEKERRDHEKRIDALEQRVATIDSRVVAMGDVVEKQGEKQRRS